MTPFLWLLLGYSIGLGVGIYGTHEVLRMQSRLGDDE